VPWFQIYVDGQKCDIIEENSREDALDKVAGWNGLAVHQVRKPRRN